MRRAALGVIAGVPVWILLAAAGESEPSDGAESNRIQGHLARAAEVLRSTTPPHLTSEQREARREIREWLDEYRAAGVFPHNHVRPGERVSVFVDPHGTPCAVGYLMLRSGAHALVERVVRANNLIRVHELRDDVSFQAWLASRGITLDEAALIQPGYDYFPEPDPEPIAVESSSYAPATVGLSIATMALFSYVAAVGTDRGGLAPDILAVGTTIGHAYMLAHSANTAFEEPKWATRVNAIGFLASVGAGVLRIMKRSDDRGPMTVAAAQPYIAPGRNGTELGFLIRH